MEKPINAGEVILDGQSLTIDDVIAVARGGKKAVLSPRGRERMKLSRAMIDKFIAEDKAVYGLTTGFGKFSSVKIGHTQTATLQENLIISHAVGVGEPFAAEVVRAMMLLRANALVQGHSGIRPEVVATLLAMLNRGVVPVVPEKGSLGASGDLAPLAHMTLVLIGRGEAFYDGERMPGGRAMAAAGITPVTLMAKEGLAMINGTQAMTAVGALACHDAFRLAKLADIAAAMAVEALDGITSAFDPKVHSLRPHPGQGTVAGNLRRLLAGSKIIEGATHGRVQDAYALRCIPQVHGASRDAFGYVRQALETEINSVTDNPLLFPETGEVISGGNFHGQPMALAFDFLGIAAAELASISERRIERLVNPALSNGLPAFLCQGGGLNNGFMILQYSAASLVSENKVLAHPASVDSIPSSANQEDHVSMGTIAARKARSIIGNLAAVLAIELFSAAQGIDLRGGEPGRGTKAGHAAVRRAAAYVEQDREFWKDLRALEALVAAGAVEQAVEAAVGQID